MSGIKPIDQESVRVKAALSQVSDQLKKFGLLLMVDPDGQLTIERETSTLSHGVSHGPEKNKSEHP